MVTMYNVKSTYEDYQSKRVDNRRCYPILLTKGEIVLWWHNLEIVGYNSRSNLPGKRLQEGVDS